MNDLLIKQFEGANIHTFLWKGKPCWIANEIVSIFNYAHAPTTIGQCIEKENFEIGIEYEFLIGDELKRFKSLVKSLVNFNLISPNTRNLTIFYEDGLYGFLQYTDKPVGIRFRKWIRREVIPEIRKTGSYSLIKADYEEEDSLVNINDNYNENIERLKIAHDSALMFKNLIEDAGLDNKVKLLTAKVLYSKVGVELPIDILEEEHFYDTKQIASMLKIFSKTKKPAFQAISEIIKKLNVDKKDFKVVWESNGSWSGTVNKYNLNVVEDIKLWLKENKNPKVIEGKNRNYYVSYEK